MSTMATTIRKSDRGGLLAPTVEAVARHGGHSESSWKDLRNIRYALEAAGVKLPHLNKSSLA